MIFVAGLASYLGTMIIILYFYMPTFLAANYGFDRASVFNVNAAALLFAAIVCPLWGWVADRIGYGLVLGIGAAGLGVSLFVFFTVLPSIATVPATLMWWYLAFSLLMATAGVVPLLSAAPFPTEHRLTGFGFGYNVGIVISATAPTVMAWVVLSHGKLAVAYFALLVGAIGVVLAMAAFHCCSTGSSANELRRFHPPLRLPLGHTRDGLGACQVSVQRLSRRQDRIWCRHESLGRDAAARLPFQAARARLRAVELRTRGRALRVRRG
jgi:MFS family permease